MKKLTAKQLLKEVRSIKKQASSGFFKPEPIEYEGEADLNVGIDSVLLDIVDGFGFLGATSVVVKGDTAFVKVEGQVELDVKKIKIVWWEEEQGRKDFIEFMEDPDWPYSFSSTSFSNGLFTGTVTGKLSEFVNTIHVDFVNEYAGVNNDVSEGFRVTGEFPDEDFYAALNAVNSLVAQIQPWWTRPETNWGKVTQDIVKGLGGQWTGEYFEYAYRLWDEGSFSEAESFQVSLNSKNNSRDYIVYDDGARGGEIVTKSELSGDYRKDIKYIANAIKKFFR